MSEASGNTFATEYLSVLRRSARHRSDRRKEGRQGSQEQAPKNPEPMRIEVDRRTTAILVLDLSARCEDPKLTCHALLPGVAGFLEKARAAGILVVFSVSASQRGTPMEKVARPASAQGERAGYLSDGFDKFTEEACSVY